MIDLKGIPNKEAIDILLSKRRELAGKIISWDVGTLDEAYFVLLGRLRRLHYDIVAYPVKKKFILHELDAIEAELLMLRLSE
jgi:hypothetical protein